MPNPIQVCGAMPCSDRNSALITAPAIVRAYSTLMPVKAIPAVPTRPKVTITGCVHGGTFQNADVTTESGADVYNCTFRDCAVEIGAGARNVSIIECAFIAGQTTIGI